MLICRRWRLQIGSAALTEFKLQIGKAVSLGDLYAVVDEIAGALDKLETATRNPPSPALPAEGEGAKPG